MIERFSRQLRDVMSQARVKALQLRHNLIGTDLILLAVLDNSLCAAYTFLVSDFRVDAQKLRDEVKKNIQSGPDGFLIPENVRLSSRAKGVLERARDIANELGMQVIGTEHLLYGLASLDLLSSSVACEALLSFGVTAEKILETLKALESASESPGREGGELAEKHVFAVTHTFEELAVGSCFIIPREPEYEPYSVYIKISDKEGDNAINMEENTPEQIQPKSRVVCVIF